MRRRLESLIAGRALYRADRWADAHSALLFNARRRALILGSPRLLFMFGFAMLVAGAPLFPLNGPAVPAQRPF